jgi:DNA-binding transcriptional ArsR family regulator
MDAYDAIADPIRRGIVELVALRSLPAGRIAEAFGDISRPAVRRHLHVLREAGLVRVEPSGRERIYRADLGALYEITSWIGSLQPEISRRLDAMETEVHRARRERRAEAR